MIWEKMWMRMQLKVRTCGQVIYLKPEVVPALVVAVDIVFRVPTVAASITYWVIAEARPLTEIEQPIWNVD